MSVQYNMEPQTAELLLRTKIAVNQLSIFGAVADWCQDFTRRAEGHASEARGDLLQTSPMTKLRKFLLSMHHILPRIQFLELRSLDRDLAQQRDEKFKNLPEDVNLAQIGDDAGSTRSVSAGQFFVTKSVFMLKGHGARVEEYTNLRNDDKAYPKDIINNTKMGPVLDV